MQIYYYTLFGFFAIITYLVSVDKNVEDYIVLVFKIIQIKFERLYYLIKFHPFWILNPIGRWWMLKKYEKIAKEISKELDNKNKTTV